MAYSPDSSTSTLDLAGRAARLTPAQMNAFWMPFTSNREFKAAPRMITGAAGCYYTADDGSQKYDTLSGLWCASYGHGRPEIAEAIADSALSLPIGPHLSAEACESVIAAVCSHA